MTTKHQRFDFLESSLILFGLALFTSSSYVFFSQVSLRKYVLGWENEISLEKVGILDFTEGDVRRKSASQNLFDQLKKKGALYNYDTIVTGSESSAKLKLDDGSSIELGPKTMIKLAFETSVSLEGIKRATTINVVSGKVKGRANKAPVIIKSRKQTLTLSEKPESLQVSIPTPELLLPKGKEIIEAPIVPPPLENPLEEEIKENLKEEQPVIAPLKEAKVETDLVILKPTHRQWYSVPKNSQVPQLKATVEWQVTPGGTPVQISLTRVSHPEQPILTETIESDLERNSYTTVIDRPGRYFWKVKTLEEESLTLSEAEKEFRVAKTYEALKLNPPLIGGEKTRSNAYTGKLQENFEVSLNWEPYPKAREYIVKVYKNQNMRDPSITKKLDSTSYTLNRGKVFSGQIFYKVLAPLSSGFLVTSPKKVFQFDFLPPALTFPQSKIDLSRKKILKEKTGILFTWQKTSFTQSYHFELSKNPTFSGKVVKRSMKENFYMIRSLPVGTYWWRVRSIGHSIESPPAPANQLVISP